MNFHDFIATIAAVFIMSTVLYLGFDGIIKLFYGIGTDYPDDFKN